MTNADLPGAPPPGDTAAWQPAGGPQGATPDATPYRAVALDMNSLSPAQRHEFRQVIKSGDRAQYEAFVANLNTTSPTPGPTVEPGTSGGEAQAPGEVVPGFEPDATPMRTTMAERLAEHGSSIEMVDALADPIDAYHARMLALPEDQRMAAALEGEQRTIDSLFHGSEGAFKVATAEIKAAALAVGGEDLVQQIDDAAILTDPTLFRRVWLMAKSVLGGRQP